MATEPRIWVLTDHVESNSNQSIALARKLSKNYELKKIEYNCFAKLPNLFLKLYPLHIKRSIVVSLINAPAPDIIICAKRRLAALAVFLKKYYQSTKKITLFQIMRPSINPKEFDLIILPQHDQFDCVLPNVVRTIGSLHNIDEQIRQVKEQFLANYPIRKHCVAVLINGTNKNYSLSLAEAKELALILKNIAANYSLKLFITFSKRTSQNIQKYFRDNISLSHLVHLSSDDSPSPYPGMLEQADYIITTSNSVSVCSEAVGTGVPVYIYTPSKFFSKKHNYFVQQLIDIGVARRLEEDSVLEAYKYKPLKELDRVVEIIKSRFF